MTGPYKYPVAMLICLCLFSVVAAGQFRFSGQFSGFMQYAPDVYQDFSVAGRYIPQLNYKIPFNTEHLIDFEASANIFGSMDAALFEDAYFDHKVKAYRYWARYSNARMEVRIGLQKINFGSAQMFRPLMWFDRMDPRDPLQLTDGVKALLGRYYFLNNANIWVWGLYDNNDLKGYELTPVSKRRPEAGGRIQLPIPKGEAALTYHYRMADPASLFPPWSSTRPSFEEVGEHKVGFDFKINAAAGFWLESSWTRFTRGLGVYTHQEMITAGADYTFDAGNGLLATFEQSIYSYDQNAFAFAHNTTISALSLRYPLNAFDKISAMVYRNWTNNDNYFFLNWEKEFNRFLFYVTGFWNPISYFLPGQTGGSNRFAGKGVQVMMVWNH